LAGSYTEGGQKLAQEDRWILSRLSATVRAHDENLDRNEVVHAVAAVHSFFWNEYCDWYLEIIKPRLWGGGAAKRAALEVAALCQRTLLQLFHPYMPFVTEELWQVLRQAGVEDSDVQGDERSVAGSRWPQHEPAVRELEVEAQMEQMISLVRAVRDVRQNLNISAKLPLKLQLAFHNPSVQANFEPVRAVAMAMGAVEQFSAYTGQGVPPGHVPLTFSAGLGYVELPSEVDAGAISSKLLGRIEKLEKQLDGIGRNLNNPEFVANAPQALVEESNAKARELQESIQKLEEFRRSLG
jgi:valyl-tRNA synthetase